MSEEKTKKTTINGVDIIDEGDVIHFIPSEYNEPKKEEPKNKNENLSWFGKIVNWFKTSKITPYVKVRDLEDPFGDNASNVDKYDVNPDAPSGYEVGIKIKF